MQPLIIASWYGSKLLLYIQREWWSKARTTIRLQYLTRLNRGPFGSISTVGKVNPTISFPWWFIPLTSFTILCFAFFICFFWIYLTLPTDWWFGDGVWESGWGWSARSQFENPCHLMQVKSLVMIPNVLHVTSDQAGPWYIPYRWVSKRGTNQLWWIWSNPQLTKAWL